MSRLAENHITLPLVSPSTPQNDSYGRVRNGAKILLNRPPFLWSQRNPVKWSEAANPTAREVRSISSGVEGGSFIWLSVEMRTRTGKTLQKALQERQGRNSEPWTNYSSQRCFTKYVCPSPWRFLFLKQGLLWKRVSWKKHDNWAKWKAAVVWYWKVM